MAKRFVDSELWDKEWYMELSLKHKCFMRFLFDKCDAAGVWSANWVLATSYIGESITEKDIIALGSRVRKIGEKKYFLDDFISFQYGNLSHACKPHLKILSLLEKHNIDSKGYTKGIQTLKEEDKDKEEDKEEERCDDFALNRFPTKPLPEHCGELPEVTAGACVQLLKYTKAVTITIERVNELWPVFLSANIDGTKFYPNVEAVRSHFINWVKTQKFETNGTVGKSIADRQQAARNKLREQGVEAHLAAEREANARA